MTFSISSASTLFSNGPFNSVHLPSFRLKLTLSLLGDGDGDECLVGDPETFAARMVPTRYKCEEVSPQWLSIPRYHYDI